MSGWFVTPSTWFSLSVRESIESCRNGHSHCIISSVSVVWVVSVPHSPYFNSIAFLMHTVCTKNNYIYYNRLLTYFCHFSLCSIICTNSICFLTLTLINWPNFIILIKKLAVLLKQAYLEMLKSWTRVNYLSNVG